MEKTVIENNLVLISDDYTDANITVIDITGKIVFNKTIALENRTDININVGKGMYIINLASTDNSVFTSKFFVN